MSQENTELQFTKEDAFKRNCEEETHEHNRVPFRCIRSNI